MMPYLDDRSKAGMVLTRRDGVGNHQLCKPDANVYRTHAVNGMCPAYATTLDIETDCCTTSFQNANPSDREFLVALNYGFQFQQQPMWNSNRYGLDRIVPDIRRWFESGRNNIQGMPAAMPASLVINMTRNWFPLVMKFYILTRPHFQIDAFDPVTNVTHAVYDNVGNVALDTSQGFTLRRRLVKCIQEVGAQSVTENYSLAIPFIPFALRCERYDCTGADIVDITNLARVVSDARCGLNNRQYLELNAVAAVSTGSWVDALVDIFLAASRRQFRSFLVKAYHIHAAGHVHVPYGMTAIPQAGGFADAQQYQPVVDGLITKLPGNNNSWQVGGVSNNNAAQNNNWNRRWTVASDAHTHWFELTVQQSYVILECHAVE
ncbi:unnamed protein product [Ectocarpus sp. 6 AP-2014]